MPVSERLSRLGSGVFARNDQRKQVYLNRWAADQASGSHDQPATAPTSAPATGLPEIIDLSLGSTDLQPPPVAIAAIAAALEDPASASYCLHGATAPCRQ